eukprot:14144415-Alexandrium_andersonii.AAC.1
MLLPVPAGSLAPTAAPSSATSASAMPTGCMSAIRPPITTGCGFFQGIAYACRLGRRPLSPPAVPRRPSPALRASPHPL